MGGVWCGRSDEKGPDCRAAVVVSARSVVQAVGAERDHLVPEPGVNLFHSLLQRRGGDSIARLN